MAAAVAGQSTARKVGLAVGAGLAAGLGAYYITQVCTRACCSLVVKRCWCALVTVERSKIVERSGAHS